MHQEDKSFMTNFALVIAGLVVVTIIVFILAHLVAGSSVVIDQTDLQKSIAKNLAPIGKAVEAGSEQAKAVEAKAQQQATAPQAQPAAAAVGGGASAEDVVKTVCAVCHQAGVANAPKIGDKTAWEPRFAKGLDGLVQSAVKGLNAMPPRGNKPDLSDAGLKAAIVYMLKQSGIEVADAAAPAPEQPAAPAATAAATTAAATPAPAPEQPAAPAAAGGALPAGVDLAQGKQLYEQACFICHQAGVAGAPKMGDKTAWGPRIAQGFDTLKEHALKGFKAMPPKGGRSDLPDEQIVSAIGYMVSQSQ
ncbi:MAG: c-type cytochrome [Gammaproteobacteria bacterium]